METDPSIVVLAGPNGAGKSTLSTQLVVRALGVSEFVDADVFGQSLPQSTSSAITAGRGALRYFGRLASEGRSFGVETTLASLSLAQRLRVLIANGYECHLVFLSLKSADLAVDRVAGRVRRGGHAVPEETIRRRYRSGLHNFFHLYRPLTTTWQMYDNSTDVLRAIAWGVAAEALEVSDPDLWDRLRMEANREE